MNDWLLADVDRGLVGGFLSGTSSLDDWRGWRVVSWPSPSDRLDKQSLWWDEAFSGPAWTGGSREPAVGVAAAGRGLGHCPALDASGSGALQLATSLLNSACMPDPVDPRV